jgi:hypothetical protein
MNQNQTEPKPADAEQLDGKGLDDTPCSPCDSAFARFHEERRQVLLDYIEKRVTRHVKSGGNDSPSYRKDCALDGIRDLPNHTDRDIWNAAWKACLENADVEARP